MLPLPGVTGAELPVHQNAAGRTVPPASQALQPLPVLSVGDFVSITLKSLPSSPSQQLPFRCFSQPLLSPGTPCTSIPCHELPPAATSCRCRALLSLPSACPATRLSLCPRALPASEDCVFWGQQQEAFHSFSGFIIFCHLSRHPPVPTPPLRPGEPLRGAGPACRQQTRPDRQSPSNH